MRYILAAIVASLVTGAGFGFGRYLKKSFIDEFRQELRTAKAEGRLPKELEGIDLDNFSLEGWEVRLPKKAERQLSLADWLLYGWHSWVPATFVVSIAVAYVTKSRAGP
jgi:hypothetical protein